MVRCSLLYEFVAMEVRFCGRRVDDGLNFHNLGTREI